jgi:chromosomal replication initiator protein
MQTIFTDEVKAIHERIAEKIGACQYQVWFEGAAQLSLLDDGLQITAANPFVSNWIEGHFHQAVSESVFEVCGRKLPLRFQIDAGCIKPQLKSVATCAISRDERLKTSQRRSPVAKGRDGRALPLKLTFDTFVVGSKNQLAFNAAQAVISQEKSPFNPLFVHGGYGVGKTHLLQGICNEIFQQTPGCRWMYLSAEDFANQYVMALKTHKLDVFRNRFRNLDILAIDDIHFLANKTAMQEEFLHTFNSIDLAGKQIVLASDAHPKEIGQLCEKLVNRFVSGMVVRIDPPDYEMRIKICVRRAEQLRLTLSRDVQEYVAESVTSGIRELEGALVKLSAYAALSHTPMTLALAQQVLAEHITRADPVVHTSDITAFSADYFGVSIADIHSEKKDRTVSLARAFAMYLTRRYTRMSYPEIGRALGDKNHATVILACRKVDDYLKTNRELKWRCRTGCRLVRAKDALDALTQKIS